MAVGEERADAASTGRLHQGIQEGVPHRLVIGLLAKGSGEALEHYCCLCWG